jgi:hypothetical protein
MSDTKSDSIARSLRNWHDADEHGQRLERLTEQILARALSAHFGFFKLLIEKCDGPIDPESGPGRIFPSEHLLAIEARQDLETASAA